MVIKWITPKHWQISEGLHVVLTIAAAFLFITYATLSHAASVTASLDKASITENEEVHLTLRADFTDTGDGPDLTPLKRDFNILGKSQTSQFSFNLGTNNTALSFWVISLVPKSVGTFEIPPIQIGQHASQPIQLKVKNSPQILDSNGNPPVMIKTEVSEIEPYLQQEVILTEKIYTSVALQNPNVSVPTNPDLVIERLVDDQMQYQTIKGTQYQVTTRDYLAFPQRSGQLTIDPQTFQAMMNTSTGRRIVKVQSQPITLQVLPIPASYPVDNWLPSQKVTIKTHISQTGSSLKVGDTLVWTIDIDAKGALPEQIPNIGFNSTRAYKLYPEPATFSSQKTLDGITGHQSIRVEVVPTDAGTLSLPDISITYWDTEERKVRTVVTKTDEVNVAPLPVTANQQVKKPAETTLPPQSKSVAPISLAKKPEKTTSATTPQQMNVTLEQKSEPYSWRKLTIKILIALIFLSIGAWGILWVRKRREKSSHEEEAVPTLQEFAPLSTSDEQSAYKQLIQCCHENRLSELRSHLLEWARHRWGDEKIHSLDDIKRLTGSISITQLLMEAELLMYSSHAAGEWQGKPLAEALEEFTSGQPKPSQSSQLKALYPNF